MKRWLVVLAACGGSSGKPDALGPDANESMGSVTVIVTERGKPVSGLPVFFSSADGTQQFAAVTSLIGECGFDLADGGFVTVLQPKSRYGIDQLTTYAGVKQADRLRLEIAPPGPTFEKFEVQVNADNDTLPVPTAYVLYTTCDAERTGIVPGVATPQAGHCPGRKVDVLVVGFDADTGVALSSQHAVLDLDVATSINLNGDYTTVTNVDIVPTGFASSTFVHTNHIVVTPNGRLFESADGGDPNTETITVAHPVVPNATLFAVSSAYPLDADFDEQQVFQWSSLAAAPNTVDVSPRLPRYMNTAPSELPPLVGTFEGGRLRWRESAGAVNASFVRARARFTREEVPLQGTTWLWQIVAPRTSTSEVAFPKLPMLSPFDFNPIDGDIATVEELTNIRLPSTMGYDSVRARAFGNLNNLVPPAQGEMLVQHRRVKVPEDKEPPEPP